jgi:hypothetical protein
MPITKAGELQNGTDADQAKQPLRNLPYGVDATITERTEQVPFNLLGTSASSP